MNDKMRSLYNRAATSSVTQRRGLGCAFVLALLLVGLVGAAIVWGQRWQNLLFNRTAAVTPAIDDRTSAENLAAHRQEAIARLNSYGWVDKEAGSAHIPIDRAIALVANSGLPVGPEATATPEPVAQPTVDLTNVTYQDDVLPIFEEHCSECHGNEDPEEQLELTRYRTAIVGSINGPVIVPGNPDESYLVEQIVSGQMPKRGDPLSSTEIEIVIAWIEAGAPEN